LYSVHLFTTTVNGYSQTVLAVCELLLFSCEFPYKITQMWLQCIKA